MTRVRVTRSGGVAGLVRRGEVDTVTAANGDQLEELLARVDLGAVPTPRPEPDRYVYDLEVGDRKLKVGERDLTPDLRRLVDRVLG